MSAANSSSTRPSAQIDQVGFVVIGRNEGDRLRNCLASLPAGVGGTVYVDSGSTDGSVEHAQQLGHDVVALDMSVPFSAARARNEGFYRLRQRFPALRYVHFIDGDCALVPGWTEKALEAFEDHEGLIAVCGRRREKHREVSVCHRICDVEWRSPPAGNAMAFGGEVLIEVQALEDVGGYDPCVIAAEDDELAIRLRRQGGRIWRLEAESSLHDAAITRLSQWWQRAIRCGHGYAQMGALHGAPPDSYFSRERRRAWIWGGALPILVVGSVLISIPLSVFLFSLYPLQVGRIARATRQEGMPEDAFAWALSCVASQPANLLGMAKYALRRWRGEVPQLIEYKHAGGSN